MLFYLILLIQLTVEKYKNKRVLTQL